MNSNDMNGESTEQKLIKALDYVDTLIEHPPIWGLTKEQMEAINNEDDLRLTLARVNRLLNEAQRMNASLVRLRALLESRVVKQDTEIDLLRERVRILHQCVQDSAATIQERDGQITKTLNELAELRAEFSNVCAQNNTQELMIEKLNAEIGPLRDFYEDHTL
jgi:Xaa-Pro aminopeptidase